MTEDDAWVGKRLTPEQITTAQEAIADAFPPPVADRLVARAWTRDDKIRTVQAWAEVSEEAERLAAAGADPAGPEGQALIDRQDGLIAEFTQEDPEIVKGMERFFEEAEVLLTEMNSRPGSPPSVEQFVERAYAARKARLGK